MRILYINHTFRCFDQLDSGASNRSAMFVTSLAQVGHVDVVSFVGNEQSTIPNCDRVYSKFIEHVKNKGRFAKMLQLFSARDPYRIYPLNKEKQQIIQNQLFFKHYDYIAIRYLNEAVECGLLDYADRLILDVDDNPKDVMLMQAKNAKTLRNKVFNYLFAYTMDKIVNRCLENVLCCFHSNPHQPPIPSSVYLHNVTMGANSVPDISNQTPVRILVVGLYHYGPNKQGVEHFLKHVYPIVRSYNTELEFHIVGKLPDDCTRSTWASYQGVKVLGFVPSLEEEYQNSRIVIVPIYSGSGTSVKVVEAMQMNRAVIATPAGMRGYDQLIDGQDYLLAKDDNLFAERIVQAIDKIDLCNNMAHNATKKYEKYFSPEAFSNVIIKTVNNHS